MQLPILSILIFFPLVGIGILLILNRKHHKGLKVATLAITVAEFLFSLPLWFNFNSQTAAMQFVERREWLPAYGVSYYVGVDGFSLLLIMLTTFLTPLCVLATWDDIQHRVKEFMVCLLALMSGMIGVFVSLDLFLFYVFWEVMLIPMYLLIGVWGNPARRVYAAIKFFLFTMFGSLLMLVAILVLYFHYGKTTGTYTFDLLKLYSISIPFNLQFWMFLAFGLAFAIKVPMFPFHTWLPDAHTEAPTVGSVILAAVLLKMGTYGFLRFNMPLFPEAAHYFVPLFSILAVIGIVYGALVSMVQKDLKRLIAFSSVSHLGFVMLGLFTFTMPGVQGGIIQMINHGLSTGALFLIVGTIYERRHTRMISEFGGLCTPMPIFAIIFMIVTLSSIGLPGLNGFVGEFLILLGTFKVNKLYAVIAATGVIFAACYMLWMFQRVVFGKVTNEKNKDLKDLSWREIAIFAPLILFIIWIGVYPSTFLDKTKASTQNFLAMMAKAKSTQVSQSHVFKGEAQ
ncbi:MAG: NADH-quinone oxidoreductase subunit M [Desulfobaccales bacterium]